MFNVEWQTVAAIVSAVAAIVAAGLSVYTVRRSLWLTALLALEQRFAQINHAKIADPESWECIRKAGPLSDAAKHLVFETFQFYHQAFLLYKRGAISKADYRTWDDRLITDLELFAAYREWWSSDQPIYHKAWDNQFINKVNGMLDRIDKKTGK